MDFRMPCHMQQRANFQLLLVLDGSMKSHLQYVSFPHPQLMLCELMSILKAHRKQVLPLQTQIQSQMQIRYL